MKDFSELSLVRISLNALALLIVIPALVILYSFREDLAGKEVALLFLFVLSLLGFYLLWIIVRAVNTLHAGLKSVSGGDAHSLSLDAGPNQLREMVDIVNALNQLSAEFRENAAQLETFIEQFSTLTEIAEITARTPDITQLLALVLKKAMSATRATRGTAMLLREDADLLDIVAAEGWSTQDAGPIELHRTLVGKVIESGTPLLIEDITNASVIEKDNDPGRYNSPSFLIMPLKTRAAAIGAVCLSERQTGRPFGNHDQQFLTVLLGQIGLAVENVRLLTRARDMAQVTAARRRMVLDADAKHRN